MMKYKGTYIKLFPMILKKYMIEQYGKEVTKKALKGAPKIYRDIFLQKLLMECFTEIIHWLQAAINVTTGSYPIRSKTRYKL